MVLASEKKLIGVDLQVENSKDVAHKVHKVRPANFEAKDKYLEVMHLKHLSGHYIIAVEPKQLVLCEVVFSLIDQETKILKVKEIDFCAEIKNNFSLKEVAE